MNNRFNKGFTLAELIIVISIIGILVAILIPIINSGLEKSREAYDIATMRQAATAAVDLYYLGIDDADSAGKYGLSWDKGGGPASYNAYGAYDPKTGKFYKKRDDLPAGSKKYGKGTQIDGGTKFVMGNDNGAYVSDLDYTNAVVMVSIYPNATPACVHVYWKYNDGPNKTKYVGGNTKTNIPDYSMKIILN